MEIFNGYVYYLWSSETSDIYIGSTKKSLKLRFSMHKSSYKRFINGKSKYMTSFDICKYLDCKIELIKKIDNCTRHQLRKLEAEEIKKSFNCVNYRIPGYIKLTNEEKIKIKNDKAKRLEEKYKRIDLSICFYSEMCKIIKNQHKELNFMKKEFLLIKNKLNKL